MTRDEAMRLMLNARGVGYHDTAAPVVTVERNGSSWTGRVIGIVERPSLLIETETGRRVAIAYADASVASPRKESDGH